MNPNELFVVLHDVPGAGKRYYGGRNTEGHAIWTQRDKAIFLTRAEVRSLPLLRGCTLEPVVKYADPPPTDQELIERVAKVLAEERARGAKEERARIVAWLRSTPECLRTGGDVYGPYEDAALELADELERADGELSAGKAET